MSALDDIVGIFERVAAGEIMRAGAAQAKKELLDLRKQLSDALAENESLKNPICAYCGERTGRTPNDVLAHIAQCDKRPEKALISKSIEITDHLEDIIDDAKNLLADDVIPYLNRQAMLADDGDALDLRANILALLEKIKPEKENGDHEQNHRQAVHHRVE